MADLSEREARKKELEETLKPRQILFCQEYLAHDMNGKEAAIAAGYAERSAEVQASRLLSNDKVSEYIDILKAERAERTGITADKVLQRLWEIATADPGEIMQVRWLNCRYCHGIDHEYQWRDEREYQEAVAAAKAAIAEYETSKKKKGKRPQIPSDAGGYGFDPHRKPHPDCPKCDGEGIKDVFIADTRDLSPAAKALYAGVKRTRDGIEVKLHSQLEALINAGKGVGLFVDKKEISGKNGGPIVVRFGRQK